MPRARLAIATALISAAAFSRTVSGDSIASEQKLVQPMIGACAGQYAQKKGVTPRDCSKEK